MNHADPDPGTLIVGSDASAPEHPIGLIARKLNRHTFLCGQSGSGKTYALGVLLERILAGTDLPLVVLDPNSDFVHLNETRLNESRPNGKNGDAANPEELRDRSIRILRPRSAPGDNLLVRFRSLPVAAKAAVVRLDPVIDREEYNSLLHADEFLNVDDPRQVLGRLASSTDPGRRALGIRIENLGVLDWEVWAGDAEAATEVILTRPNATVLDLGGFRTADEPLAAALSVLNDLWDRRMERRPALIVIDEAHNLCSPDLETPLGRAVREQIIQIAAEGRKFGLWLLLSTQRPSKIHPNVISQCDNLVLMRMSSPADVAELGTVFGYAPRELLERAPGFGQGEMLLAGGFVERPVIARVRGRLTPEGGGDVEVPLRASRS